MKTSEFLHLLGNSLGSAGSWDVFRGRWHHTTISGIPLLRGVLSRAVGCFLCVLLLLLRFSVTARSGILNRIHRIFHQNFVIFVHRLLGVTTSPGVGCRPRQTKMNAHVLVTVQ